jgi:DNA-damage-inducible protein D
MFFSFFGDDSQENVFDKIKHLDENGAEYWLSRELQEVLQYAQWRRFEDTINRAKISCNISQQDVNYHFAKLGKTIAMPKGAEKIVTDYRLSRYACYLIVMNGDPHKEVIAFGQTYFAVKTRQQELQEIYDLLNEDERRLFLRGDVRQKNKLLANAAKKAGVKTNLEYATFQDYGYKGLYGGETARDIANRKGLESGEEILDHMGSEELAANLFRITQTESKLKRDNIETPTKANITHKSVGQAVRKTIAELGGTMPENLPAPDKSTKILEIEQLKKLKE